MRFPFVGQMVYLHRKWECLPIGVFKWTPMGYKPLALSSSCPMGIVPSFVESPVLHSNSLVFCL